MRPTTHKKKRRRTVVIVLRGCVMRADPAVARELQTQERSAIRREWATNNLAE